MLTSTESIPPASAAAGAAHECDFCGRAVHEATAVERVHGDDDQETVTLCVECALEAD